MGASCQTGVQSWFHVQVSLLITCTCWSHQPRLSKRDEPALPDQSFPGYLALCYLVFHCLPLRNRSRQVYKDSTGSNRQVDTKNKPADGRSGSVLPDSVFRLRNKTAPCETTESRVFFSLIPVTGPSGLCSLQRRSRSYTSQSQTSDLARGRMLVFWSVIRLSAWRAKLAAMGFPL